MSFFSLSPSLLLKNVTKNCVCGGCCYLKVPVTDLKMVAKATQMPTTGGINKR